jgi:hypothetical protein
VNFRRVVVTALVLSAALLSLAGCSKSTSTTSPAALDSTPPAAPTSLAGIYDAGQQTDYLIWTSSSSANAATCEVWQYDGAPAAGNTGRLVGTVPVTTSFIGLPTPTQNTVQYFRLRTLSTAGTPSAFSATISLQRHGAPVQLTTDTGLDEPSVQRH